MLISRSTILLIRRRGEVVLISSMSPRSPERKRERGSCNASAFEDTWYDTARARLSENEADDLTRAAYLFRMRRLLIETFKVARAMLQRPMRRGYAYVLLMTRRQFEEKTPGSKIKRVRRFCYHQQTSLHCHERVSPSRAVSG